MFLKPKHFIFECRPNFGSFCPLPGLLRAITFSAPNPPPLQISAYATNCVEIWQLCVKLGPLCSVPKNRPNYVDSQSYKKYL